MQAEEQPEISFVEEGGVKILLEPLPDLSEAAVHSHMDNVLAIQAKRPLAVPAPLPSETRVLKDFISHQRMAAQPLVDGTPREDASPVSNPERHVIPYGGNWSGEQREDQEVQHGHESGLPKTVHHKPRPAGEQRKGAAFGLTGYSRNAMGRKPHISVEEQEPFTRGVLCELGAGKVLAAPSGRQRYRRDPPNAGVPFGKTVDHERSAILRVVVIDQDFRGALGQERFEAIGQTMFFVARGNQNGDTVSGSSGTADLSPAQDVPRHNAEQGGCNELQDQAATGFFSAQRTAIWSTAAIKGAARVPKWCCKTDLAWAIIS